MDNDEEVKSLLREIRDAAIAHQRYIERQELGQKLGCVFWLLLLIALFLIAFAQFRR